LITKKLKGIFMKKTSFLILGCMLFSAIVMVPSLVQPTQAKTSANTFHVELWYTTAHYGDTEPDVAQMVKSQLEATGYFDVELKSTDWTTYKAQRNAGTMPFFLMGWWPDYQDESDYLQPFVGKWAFFSR
jgi:ABC-type oligopeptide transport system substrate-binding subunit